MKESKKPEIWFERKYLFFYRCIDIKGFFLLFGGFFSVALMAAAGSFFYKKQISNILVLVCYTFAVVTFVWIIITLIRHTGSRRR